MLARKYRSDSITQMYPHWTIRELCLTSIALVPSKHNNAQSSRQPRQKNRSEKEESKVEITKPTALG